MKIAICTPCAGDPRAAYSQSLARMVARSLKTMPDLELEIFFRSGSVLVRNRNMLVEDARNFGADATLWIDSDHSFPPDTLLRLLAHDLEIVGCNQPRRASPTGPTAWKGANNEPVWTTPDKASAKEVEEVSGFGLALCLIRAGVMDEITPPCFGMEMLRDGRIVGEDHFFFAKVRQAGFKIWVDHALSWDVGHVADHMLWNADALTDRVKWLVSHTKPQAAPKGK